MESRQRLFLLVSVVFVYVTFFSSPTGAQDFRVGVSPSVIDLKNVQPGSVYTVSFNVITPSQEPLDIFLEAERGNLDFFSRPGYSEFLNQYSEQDASQWVRFIENPFKLSSGDRPISGPQGTRGTRQVNFLLHVPEDAEPGLHSVKINPVPSTQGSSLGGAGANVAAVTTVTVLFTVPGEAVRSGELSGTVQGGYEGQNMRINNYFENTGTVTISVRINQMFYLTGLSIENTSSPLAYIRPGESANLQTFLHAAGLESGDYEVLTEASYTTNSSFRNSTIVVVEPPPTPQSSVSIREGGIPVWTVILIIVIVVIVSMLIYWWYK